ncbi:MAG: transposase, partial [Actinomycetota bacterium]|nr:transposase [Actinomycetota bacterium]
MCRHAAPAPLGSGRVGPGADRCGTAVSVPGSPARERIRSRNRRFGTGPTRRRPGLQRLPHSAHARVANQRADFHHKAARALLCSYDRIGVEDLAAKNLSRVG